MNDVIIINLFDCANDNDFLCDSCGTYVPAVDGYCTRCIEEGLAEIDERRNWHGDDDI